MTFYLYLINIVKKYKHLKKCSIYYSFNHRINKKNTGTKFS